MERIENAERKGGSFIPFSEAEMGRIAALAAEGLNTPKIAEITGRSVSGIRRIAAREDIHLSIRDSGHYGEDEIRTMREMVDTHSPKEIAAALGRKVVSVRVAMRRRGIMAPKRIDEAARDRIASAYLAGESQQSIADRFCVSRKCVERHLRISGAVRPGSRIVSPPQPHDGAIRAMAAKGMGQTEIARRLGLKRSAVESRLATLARHDAIREMSS
ncbi:MAG: helix-turn-helix domain-containing protein [Fulvimarina manganoxydans]|uniref:helix-turn-helix domain-containing protein n=1 Tax=Fulvimarina manganoxydans TaxID=937218 RepID=UPI002354CDFA|nr:helix-turn-helix domain-containing protein [Fulvimarina manganoxydans]MCK5930991.1 helix-turn-helix domain-containing protein [Fulvimarina manganoxydans]